MKSGKEHVIVRELTDSELDKFKKELATEIFRENFVGSYTFTSLIIRLQDISAVSFKLVTE